MATRTRRTCARTASPRGPAPAVSTSDAKEAEFALVHLGVRKSKHQMTEAGARFIICNPCNLHHVKKVLLNKSDYHGDVATLVRLLQSENESCLSALYAEVKPRYTTGKPFVLAECPYLYWWTDAAQARAAQTKELQLYDAKYPNSLGSVMECFHCQKSFPKGDSLPGQNVQGKNAKLCIFWPTEMWKKRKTRKNMQCHQCRHKDVMHHCKGVFDGFSSPDGLSSATPAPSAKVDGDIMGNPTIDDSDAGEMSSQGSHGTPERTQEDPRKIVAFEERVAGCEGSSEVGMGGPQTDVIFRESDRDDAQRQLAEPKTLVICRRKPGELEEDFRKRQLKETGQSSVLPSPKVVNDRSTIGSSDNGEHVAAEGSRLEDDPGLQSADASESSPERTQEYAAVEAREINPEDAMRFLPAGCKVSLSALASDGVPDSQPSQQQLSQTPNTRAPTDGRPPTPPQKVLNVIEASLPMPQDSSREAFRPRPALCKLNESFRTRTRVDDSEEKTALILGQSRPVCFIVNDEEVQGDLYVLQAVDGINEEWNVLGRVKFTYEICGVAVEAFYEGDVHLPGNNAEDEDESDNSEDESDNESDENVEDESDKNVAGASRHKSPRNFGKIPGSDDDEDGPDAEHEGDGSEDDGNEPTMEVVEFTGAGSLCVGPAGRELVRGCFDTGCFKDCSPTMGTTVQDANVVEIMTMWLDHKDYWVRVWEAVALPTGGCQIAEKCPLVYEVRRFDDYLSSRCFSSGSCDLMFLPAGTLRLALCKKNKRTDWIGPLDLRPESVIGHDPIGYAYAKHNGWISAEACYDFYDTVYQWKVAQGVRLAYGAWGCNGHLFKREVGSATEHGFDRLMRRENVRAIMFAPGLYAIGRDGHKQEYTGSRANAWCETDGVVRYGLEEYDLSEEADSIQQQKAQRRGAYYRPLRIFFQSPDATSASPKLFGDLMEGFPVAVTDDFALKYFPDHWDFAQSCPNMPVVIDYVRDRIPCVQNAYVQLMDHLTLRNILREDKHTRLAAPNGSFSVMWALLDRAFGMHGVRRQVEAMGYLGMSPEELRPDFHKVNVPANLRGQLEQIEAVHVKSSVAAPAFVDFQPSTDVKSTTKLRMVADAARHTLQKSPDDDTCVINVVQVCYHPQSARSPFRIQLSESEGFKKYAKKRKSVVFQSTHSVSIQWMLTQFHPMFLAMARDEIWRPECFKEAVNGGMPEYQYTAPKEGESVVVWNHGVFREHANLIGATEGQAVSGCARNSFLTALRVYSDCDEGVEQHVQRTWFDWVEWNSLGRLVQTLNNVSSLKKIHQLVRLNGDDLLLPMTRLGRAHLFDAGFRSLLLRPVASGRGWVRHALALTACPLGDWTLHDPTENDAGIVLLGGLPGVDRLQGAYFLRVRAKGCKYVTRDAQDGPPKKKIKVGVSLRLTFPDPPSTSASIDYLLCTLVDRAFASFAFHCGLPLKGSPDARCASLPLNVRRRRSMPPLELFQMLASEHIAAPLVYESYCPSVLLEYPPIELRFFLVGAVWPDYARRAVTGVYLVRVLSAEIELFCPARKSFVRHRRGKPKLDWCQGITWA